MVTFKQQVVQKALDNYIESQERGLEVAQKALAMHQKMHRAELQEAEALGRPVSEVEYIDTENRVLRDELLDGQRELEATRQRIEEARTARLSGPRASEDFLNDHKGDNWADQTALDDFGVAPPEDSGLGPIEDYEPGSGPSTPGSEPSTVDAGAEPPMVDAGKKMPTLNTGKKEPDWTLKPGEAQPPPGPSAPPSVAPSPEPSTTGPSDQLPPVEPGGAPSARGPGGAEPSEGPGLVSRIAQWIAGTGLVKAARVGFEVVKGRFTKVAAVLGAAAAAVGLIYTFWPSGGAPEPRPPEPPGVQVPSAPGAPEPPPPNPFEPPQAPEGVPENPFGGPETVPANPFEPQAPPPNPFEPPQAPEGVPENPFGPPGQQGASPDRTAASAAEAATPEALEVTRETPAARVVAPTAPETRAVAATEAKRRTLRIGERASPKTPPGAISGPERSGCSGCQRRRRRLYSHSALPDTRQRGEYFPRSARSGRTSAGVPGRPPLVGEGDLERDGVRGGSCASPFVRSRVIGVDRFGVVVGRQPCRSTRLAGR